MAWARLGSHGMVRMLARHLHLYFSAFSVAKAGVFLSHIVTEAHMEWWTRIFFLADVK